MNGVQYLDDHFKNRNRKNRKSRIRMKASFQRLVLVIAVLSVMTITTFSVSNTERATAGIIFTWGKNLWGTSKHDKPHATVIHGSYIYIAGALYKDHIVENAKQLFRVTKHDLNGNYHGKDKGDCVNSIIGDIVQAEGITKDVNGDIYVTGHIRCFSWNEKVKFKVYDEYGNKIDQRTFHIHRGEAEGLLMKLSGSNLRILWTETQRSGDETKGTGIITSSDNNYVYVAGHYKGSRFKMDGDTYLYNKGNFDVFIAQYTTSGSPVSAIGIGGVDDEGKPHITRDSWGNLYVTGYFRSSTVYVYDKHSIIATINKVSDGSDVFVVKLTPSLDLVWAKAFGGPSDDREVSITTGDGNFADDIYVTGYFENWLLLPGIGYLNGKGGKDVYGVLIKSDGSFGGGIVIGGIGDEKSYDIKVVPNTGRIFITGSFSSQTLQIGNYVLQSQGGKDVFLVELDRFGTIYSAGSAGGSGSDEGTALATANGIVILAGIYDSNPMYIGSYPLYKQGSGSDAFFMRLNHYV